MERKEYSKHIQKFRHKYQDKLEIVMRVYFEKPRTTIGWKGLINDPHLDGSYDINTGLRRARSLLSYLATRGIPAATELLDPIVPQYIADLISWTAIGARTTESQTHREMASGLSMPIGFKNGTDGSFSTAINAMQSASKSHHFLGVNDHGYASIVNTTGNPDGHIVLRGGSKGVNFENQHVKSISCELRENNLPCKVMIDCSHGNSNKDFRKQSKVLKNVSNQISNGEKNMSFIILIFKANFFWADIEIEDLKLENYDHVIMNPPYHKGKKFVHSLVTIFLNTAKKILVKNGIDLVFCNLSEAKLLTRENDLEGCKKKMREVVPRFVITLGKHGSYAFDGNSGYSSQSPRIKAQDSTGAGDTLSLIHI